MGHDHTRSIGRSTEWTITISGTTFRPSIRVASRGLPALSCRLTQLRNFQCRPPRDPKAGVTLVAQLTLSSSPGPTTFMGHFITTIGTNISLSPRPSLLLALSALLLAPPLASSRKLPESATRTTDFPSAARSLRIKHSISSVTRRMTSYLVSPELRQNLQMPG